MARQVKSVLEHLARERADRLTYRSVVVVVVPLPPFIYLLSKRI